MSELAFARGGAIAPHDNPNTTWFCVIEGGGWVLVGDERGGSRPGRRSCGRPDVIHAAWTDHGEMRAIVVEFAGADDARAPWGAEGAAGAWAAASHRAPAPRRWALSPARTRWTRIAYDRTEGEPL